MLIKDPAVGMSGPQISLHIGCGGAYQAPPRATQLRSVFESVSNTAAHPTACGVADALQRAVDSGVCAPLFDDLIAKLQRLGESSCDWEGILRLSDAPGRSGSPVVAEGTTPVVRPTTDTSDQQQGSQDYSEYVDSFGTYIAMPPSPQSTDESCGALGEAAVDALLAAAELPRALRFKPESRSQREGQHTAQPADTPERPDWASTHPTYPEQCAEPEADPPPP
eukprot:Hpha_TRINITY_DN14479_c0_g1::TRINITY_DN14479_c0_g1_i2::g.157779::m.157779